MPVLHHNTIWLTPTQAAELSGYERHSFRRLAMDGLIRVKENPRHRKKPKTRDMGWLYHRRDIEKNVMGIE